MRIRIVFLLILLISSLSFSFAQWNDSLQHETQFNKIDQLFNNACDSAEDIISALEINENLTPLEKSKINFFRAKIYDLNEFDAAFDENFDISTDSASHLSLLEQATKYIVQSRPDDGIPLLFEFLQTVDGHSDSAVFAKIYLAEAYREKEEYQKGVDILYGQLNIKTLSTKNRAFAYNRLAALYNQGKGWMKVTNDSTIKYSQLCIEFSREHNFPEYYAASQNELAYIYFGQRKLQPALDLSTQAVNNFIKLEMYPQAMNASIVLAKICKALKKYDAAERVLHVALDLCDIGQYRNLQLRIYSMLSGLYKETGNYKSAYDYLYIMHRMQRTYYYDRIKSEIFDMTAKYNLEQKERKIFEEQQRIKTYQQQKRYLIIIVIISLLLFVILLILFRFKNSAYKALLKQNLQSQELRAKLDANIRNDNISDDMDIDKVSDDDKYILLGKKLEKFMVEEQPYLFEDFSIEDTCKKLNTNRTYVSKAISIYFKKSFNDLLFDFRLKAAHELLINPENDHLSIEGVAKMSGFKSTSGFHKKFKQATGLTPHYFRSNRE